MTGASTMHAVEISGIRTWLQKHSSPKEGYLLLKITKEIGGWGLGVMGGFVSKAKHYKGVNKTWNFQRNEGR